MNPQFSVVIVAHDRKKYLPEAVKSVLDQKVEREVYEIIVVKNFLDEEIDAFLKKNEVKYFFTDKKSFGQKLAIGIENSKGAIISFLDDDDTFTENKFSSLLKVFQDPEVTYHHSSIISIDEMGQEHQSGLSENIKESLVFSSDKLPSYYSKVMKFKGDWYASSISVRKDVLLGNIEFIRNSDTSLDRILFFISASTVGKLYLDSRITTRYRVHPSVTTMLTDYEDFVRRRSDFYDRSYKALKALFDFLHNDSLEAVFRLELIHTELMRYFFTDNGADISNSKLIRALFTGLRWRIRSVTFWALVCYIRKIRPNFIRTLLYKNTMSKFRRFNTNSS